MIRDLQKIANKTLKIPEATYMIAAQRQKNERRLKQLRDGYAIRMTAFKEGQEDMIKILLLKGVLSPTKIAEVFNLEQSYVISIKERLAKAKK